MLAKSLLTAALTGGLAFGIGLPAHAAEAACTTIKVQVSAPVDAVPAVYGDTPLLAPAQDAWTERVLVSAAIDEASRIVQHAAIYDERVVIDQPYVAGAPAVAEQFHWVHHPAVTTIVTHDAVTKTVRHEAETTTTYQRYAWTGGGSGPAAGNTPLTNPGDWQSNNKGYDGSAPDTVLSASNGKGNGSYFYWKSTVTVVKVAWDEKVVIKAAWDEVVEVKAAWSEKIIDVPAAPAVPEQPEVSHIERVLVKAAWDEKVIDVPATTAVYADIVHPAVGARYGAPVLVSEGTPAQPGVYRDVLVCEPGSMGPEQGGEQPTDTVTGPTAVLASSSEPGEGMPSPAALSATGELAATGGDASAVLPIAAGVLVAAGVAMLATRRSRREAR